MFLPSRRAILKCLNFDFQASPEGKFLETIVAAQGELGRAKQEADRTEGESKGKHEPLISYGMSRSSASPSRLITDRLAQNPRARGSFDDLARTAM